MLAFPNHRQGMYDTARQWPDFLRQQAAELTATHRSALAALATQADVVEYQHEIRDTFLEGIGGLPEEHTPLNEQVTGTLEVAGITIEKTVFESLPQVYVTALLYLPSHRVHPCPGVLVACGHAEEAKSYGLYHKACLDLARHGLVVLAFDPPGQGERMGYIDPGTGKQIVSWGTYEHSYAGLQCYLTGGTVARHFIWDGIRAFDLLASRPEVDPARIGVVGNSGGGTQTCLLMVAEPRIAAAMPCCYLHNLFEYLKTGQAHDAEQNLPDAFVRGFDHEDYLIAFAPKPVRVGSATFDYFMLEANTATIERARRVFEVLGASERIEHWLAREQHGFSDKLREGAVRFFTREFLGEEAFSGPLDIEPLSPDQLLCTETGQVVTAFEDARTVFDLNLAALEECARDGAPRAASEVQRAVVSFLEIADDKRQSPAYPKLLKHEEAGERVDENWVLVSEPDVVLTASCVKAKAGAEREKVVLFLLDEGTDAAEADRSVFEQYLEGGTDVFVLDLRGLGGVKSYPINAQDYNGCYGHEYVMAYNAIMLGTSTLAQRVFDVLRGYEALLEIGYERGNIGLHACGVVAVYGYIAAALEEGISEVVCEDMLVSFRDVAATRYYKYETYNERLAAWGVLKHFDLPELETCFAGRKRDVIRPRRADGEVAT